MCNNKFYIFDLVTTYHLISALSFCISKSCKGDEIVVYYIEDMDGKYQFSDISFISDSGVLISLRKQKKLNGFYWTIVPFVNRLLSFRETRSSIYLGHHTYYKPTVARYLDKKELMLGRKFFTFGFEEGVGTYNGFSQEKDVALREKKKYFLAKFVLKKILRSRLFLDFKWGLLKDKSEEVDKCYKSAASIVLNNLYSELNGLKGTKLADLSNKVVYFTTPFVKIDLMSNEEYNDFFCRVVKYFEENNIPLVIKPHPLDDFSYEDIAPNADVIESSAPAEIMMLGFNVKMVAGVNSTALVTASCLYDCHAINMVDFLPEKTRNRLNLGVELQSIFDNNTSRVDEEHFSCSRGNGF
ncbi:alpha-2,8-polysialyltransferase family protein [Halomonas sp. EF61]|uniref:polysialyltransferase family glycosyltransferase n=1 Tax=Halomonas sp. EF61 TaxID=2950869 RepID=UPI0032DFD81F